MRLLKQWINASAEQKQYFQQKLEAWAADIDQGQSHYFNKEEAYHRFKERVSRARDLMSSADDSPSDPVPKGHLRRRIYFRVASYAAMLLLVIGTVYFIKTGGFLNSFKKVNAPKLSYIEIKVPPGSREQFTLPDKTVVWINAGSTFKYPANFKGQTRSVYLNGEGFFEVAKDATHPFIVHTAKGNITVTGTTFNVNSYDAKSRFETALLEGHVHVNTPDGQIVNLLPSQKAALNNSTLVVRPIDDPDAYRWIEGLISFDNERISEVLENLENTFGQKITIQQLDNPNLLLTGKFRVSDGLEYALKILSESYGIKYKKDKQGNSFIIIN